MTLFRRDRKDHWEQVYQKLSPQEVRWYQTYPASSLQLIDKTSPDRASRIIDVGGGAFTLCLHLLDQGYRDLTVPDISHTSIEKAKSQLGERAGKIKIQRAYGCKIQP